jgi:transposase-like protein
MNNSNQPISAVIYCRRNEHDSRYHCALCDHALDVSQIGEHAINKGATPVCAECEKPFTAHMKQRGAKPHEKKIKVQQRAFIVPGKGDIN